MRLKLAAVLLLTGLCLAWVLWGIDFPAALERLGEVRWGWMALVGALYLTAHALRVVRLRALLDRPIPFWSVFSILSIGYLAIHVVPFRTGEFVRPALLAEKEDLPFGAGLAAIFVERLLDMLMLLGMMLLVSFAVPLPEGRIVVQGVDVLQTGQRAVGVLVALGTVGVVGLFAVGEPVLRWTDRLPMGSFVRRFREAIARLARRPWALFVVLVESVAIWFVTVVAIWLSLLAFPGMPSTLGDALALWTVTLTGMTVLPTPGFFGAFELACSTMLELLGADPAGTATFAVLLHLGQFGFTILLGVIFLAWEGQSLREVVGRSRTVQPPGAA